MIEFEHVGDTVVYLWPAGPVANDDWAGVMKVLRETPVKWCIHACVGALQLTSVQRREGSIFLSEHRIKTLVITDDRLVRGFVTAASWVGANISACSWNDMRVAMERIGFDHDKVANVASTISVLRRSGERRPSSIRKAGQAASIG